MPAGEPQQLLGLIVENIGGGELVVILFLALVVLGPERIPDMARSAGRLINKVKTMSSDITGEMNDVINDPSMQPIRELGEFATRPRQKLAEYALEAEAEERRRKATGDPGDDTGSASVPPAPADPQEPRSSGASAQDGSDDAAEAEPADDHDVSSRTN